MKTAMDVAEYCRELEAYLCRKNEGHLIRIVGPAFEQVSGWAAQGVPLAVAFKGVDQYCERYHYAKGGRRRPVRIEFCEGDILTLFDDWRRAVGVTRLSDAATDTATDAASDTATDAATDTAPPAKRDSLPAHLDRTIARLTALRAGALSPSYDRRLDDAVRELDRARAAARQSRGEARSALIGRLGELDRELLDAAREQVEASQSAAMRAEAEAEIAPFAARMAPDARARAIDAAFDRLLREAVGLPVLTHDA